MARVLVEDENEGSQLIGPQSDWYPDKYPCPLCDERCAFSTKLLEDNVGRIHDLSVSEAFLAFNGVGLPGEHECGATRVEKLLMENTIESVAVRPIGNTPRCVLRRIVLSGGTTLHLGASTHGAVVYRISEKEKYVRD